MSIVMSVNAGSSSLKFQVFKMPEEEVLAQGNVERIGLKDSIFGMKVNGEKFETVQDIEDHAQKNNTHTDRNSNHKHGVQTADKGQVCHCLLRTQPYGVYDILKTEDAAEKEAENR